MNPRMKTAANVPASATGVNGSSPANDLNRNPRIDHAAPVSGLRFENPNDPGRPLTVTMTQDGRAMFTFGDDPITACRIPLTECQIAEIHLMFTQWNEADCAVNR